MQRLATLAGESARRRKLRRRPDELREDELAWRSTGERLGYREQILEPRRVERRDEDRALGRWGRSELER